MNRHDKAVWHLKGVARHIVSGVTKPENALDAILRIIVGDEQKLKELKDKAKSEEYKL